MVASSQRDNHRPKLAVDGNPATAWMTKAEGVGQTITMHFKSPATITSVSILNGDGMDLEHYQADNRVRTMRMTLGDGTAQVLSFADKIEMQRFAVEHRVLTETVHFEILSVFKGKKNNWTAISEIAFNRGASN